VPTTGKATDRCHLLVQPRRPGGEKQAAWATSSP
jgi:hypothetical protein